MALFGLFGKKDPAAEIKKLVHRATQKFGPPDTRARALEQLREMGTPESIRAILQRFEVRVDPGITDDEEKQYVFETIVETGQAAVEPIRDFLRKTEQPTWALRALAELVSVEETVQTVLDVLEHEGPDYTRDPEKKITLLKYLEQHQDSRIVPGAVPFLQDMSEDVRVAAVSLIASQPADESAAEPLIKALLQANEDSSERMKRSIAEGLRSLELSVKGHTPSVEAALPQGYSVNKAGVVVAK